MIKNLRIKMDDQCKTIRTNKYELVINLAGNEWYFNTPDGIAPLIAANSAFVIYPVIPGTQIRGIQINEYDRLPNGCRRIRIRGEIAGDVEGELGNELFLFEDRVVCDAWYCAKKDHALEHWAIAPEGSMLTAEKIHVYAGQNRGRDENGTVFPAASVDLSTKTHNWMYAGAVPRMLFYRGGFGVLFGGTRLAGDFGMELKTENGKIRHFRFNCGGESSPQFIRAGEIRLGPRLQIEVSFSLQHDEAHATFTGSLINDGILPPKYYQPEDLAWRRPWYCTWGDQVGTAKSMLRQDQAGKEDYDAIKKVLTQAMVLKAARLIRKENLNIGTIIIDDGWQDKRGDWNLAPEKFPDMRGLVAELHAMDFKVVIWWAPFLVEPSAQILGKRGFIAGPTPQHKAMVIDYGNPDVRKWICAKFETWFSNNAGGWNVDGLKLDFLPEKIYPENQRTDPAWRGEENCFYKLLEMIDTHIRKHKISPGLLHVPYNPHYMRFAVAVHGEERFDNDLDYLRLRPALIKALIPGTWYAPHFNYNTDYVPDFIRAVKRAGGIVQIGKLIGPDVTSALISEMHELLQDAG